ncbi:MAG: hypothetical protein CMH54_13435 [Myxococcales bacterium]|nr:hypothetical protein [Myxococcales bacterium]
MRNRNKLRSLIKTFRVDENDTKAKGSDQVLIGGDLRTVIQSSQSPLTGSNVVDSIRDEESVHRFLAQLADYEQVSLEIGSATGTFAVQAAANEPNTLFLASEVRQVLLRKAQKKRAHQNLENLFLMLGDVRLQLPPLLSNGPIFHRIFILFPDPWWKRRHWKRRLFQPGFLSFLATAVHMEGLVVLKSDVEEYRDQAKKLVDSCPYFRIVSDPAIEEYVAAMPPSRRQKELVDADLPIYTLVLQRTENPQFSSDDV